MGTEKLKAKAKQAGSTLKGDTGIIATLKGEHTEVASLMTELHRRDDGDLHARHELFQKIRQALLIHARAEQQVFYTECLRHTAMQSLIHEAQGEHQEIEQLLHQLSTMALDSLGWMDTFAQLRERVEHHVKVEEGIVFPKSKEVLSKEDLRRLDQQYNGEREHVERMLPPIELPGSPSLGEQWP